MGSMREQFLAFVEQHNVVLPEGIQELLNKASANVLITGGTGYLGRILVELFVKQGHKVSYTYHSNEPLLPSICPSEHAFKVDFVSGEGVNEMLQALPDLNLVINTAAISQPKECQDNKDVARAINIPSKLIEGLLAAFSATKDKNDPKLPLFIQISTDQVYKGDKANWTEDDDCEPVNVYGQTKLEAEVYIRMNYHKSIILRSSIIYGPIPSGNFPRRSLFLQFVYTTLKRQHPTKFYDDEYRNPVCVEDLAVVMVRLAVMTCHRVITEELPLVLNAGGPERLSRVDFARVVAQHFGFGTGAILPASAKERAIACPLDISMDSSRLTKFTGLKPRSLKQALEECTLCDDKDLTV